MQTYYKDLRDACQDYLPLLKDGGTVLFQDEWGRTGFLQYGESPTSSTAGVEAVYDQPTRATLLLVDRKSLEADNRICGGLF